MVTVDTDHNAIFHRNSLLLNYYRFLVCWSFLDTVVCSAESLLGALTAAKSRLEGESMAKGQVKWFNNAKGYGFILPDEGGEDLFAHFSSINMDGYKSLKAGDSVEFEVLEGPKGIHAINIKTTGSEPQAEITNNESGDHLSG